MSISFTFTIFQDLCNINKYQKVLFKKYIKFRKQSLFTLAWWGGGGFYLLSLNPFKSPLEKYTCLLFFYMSRRKLLSPGLTPSRRDSRTEPHPSCRRTLGTGYCLRPCSVCISELQIAPRIINIRISPGPRSSGNIIIQESWFFATILNFLKPYIFATQWLNVSYFKLRLFDLTE